MKQRIRQCSSPRHIEQSIGVPYTWINQKSIINNVIASESWNKFRFPHSLAHLRWNLNLFDCLSVPSAFLLVYRSLSTQTERE